MRTRAAQSIGVMAALVPAAMSLTQPHPIKGGNGLTGLDPAGVDADLAHQAAGAHAGGDGCAVHLHVEDAGGQRAGDGAGQSGCDPDAGVLHDVAHLEHTGAEALTDEAADTVFLIAHDGEADHLGAAACHSSAAPRAPGKIAGSCTFVCSFSPK